MQIKFVDVSFTYNPKTDFKVHALKNINLELNPTNITAIVGRTGSGKSTLTELINKLITPTEGEIHIDNLVNSKKVKIKKKVIKEYRKNIGFLFQFSENQLFEDTVKKDILFGVKNFYPKLKEIDRLAVDAIKQVGLDESYLSRSPFDLSGGEKKRVAIAGILSYKPKLLILDEPTVGLDSVGKKNIMDLFKQINSTGVGIILVTHDMDVVLEYADNMIIIDDGEIVRTGTPKEILKEDVEQYSLETPAIFKLVHELNKRGKNIDNTKVSDIPSLIKELKK